MRFQFGTSKRSPEYGEAKENIEKDYKGDAISIGFNSSYVLDFLAAVADGPISIELKDEQFARPDAPARRRILPLPLHHHDHAHAHLMNEVMSFGAFG